MVSLCKRAVDMSDETLLSYVTEAYPIVVFCKQLENKQRRMMEIMECEILPNGDRRYNTLFRYVITENHMENDKFIIEGHHAQVNEISVSLRKRLLENGMPNEELQALLNLKKEVNALDSPAADCVRRDDHRRISYLPYLAHGLHAGCVPPVDRRAQKHPG